MCLLVFSHFQLARKYFGDINQKNEASETKASHVAHMVDPCSASLFSLSSLPGRFENGEDYTFCNRIFSSMKASDYIAQVLADQGIEHVFEVSGGMIAHLLDSLHRQQRVRIWSMRHEQSAAFACDAVGRVKGLSSVAMATSGPGATNLLTGIGSCFFDSSPALFITGQVNRTELKRDRKVRQLGFQETDIVSMASPITKAAWQVGSIDQLPMMIANAMVTAKTGRPGPVLLDIPMDIQREQVTPIAWPATTATLHDLTPLASVENCLATLQSASRPLVLAGGGIRAGNSTQQFREFIETRKIPVVYSLLGVDALPSSSKYRIGMIGTYGNRWANLALSRCDALVVLGSRLDIRQTGSDTQAFKSGRTIVHVDIEDGEMNNRVTGCTTIQCDLRSFFDACLATEVKPFREEHFAWISELSISRQSWPDDRELNIVTGINPNRFMHSLSAISREAIAFVVDVGQHQMWAAQSIALGDSQRFLTSGGMGAMGFALPAAIGACVASNGTPVVVIAGDGGFQFNIQELETIAYHQLPIKMVVINNRCHGMVRQFQESFFEGRYGSTLSGYSAPDFARVAHAYGIPGHTCSKQEDVSSSLEWLWNEPSRPALLQVMIETTLNAFPKVAFGRTLAEMEPYSKPLDIEST
jgi:acetolactate synthase-1/2/3 large subunit